MMYQIYGDDGLTHMVIYKTDDTHPDGRSRDYVEALCGHGDLTFPGRPWYPRRHAIRSLDVITCMACLATDQTMADALNFRTHWMLDHAHGVL